MVKRVIIGKVVPQKGEDYFTEDDILELQEYFAPSGYGVGEDTRQVINKEYLNYIFVSGLYWLECPGSVINDMQFDQAFLRVFGKDSLHCIQEIYPLGHSAKLTRFCCNGVWQDGWGLYEWKNDVVF